MDEKSVSPLAVIMTMRGKTQQQIADLLDVRRETVSNWMTGKTIPKLSLEEWDKLAKFLGTTMDKLPKSFAPQPIHNSLEQSQN
jgi:transcriptional regulator with XRE-family HTH domain